MVNHDIEIKHAAVEPALPCDARCTALPVGCSEVQTGKPQCAATAFFKFKPQVDAREQHAVLQIFVAGIVHAHKPLGGRGLKGAAHIKRKSKPPRKPLISHRHQAPQGGHGSVPSQGCAQRPLHVRARQSVRPEKKGQTGLYPAFRAAQSRHRGLIRHKTQGQRTAASVVPLQLACQRKIHGFERRPRHHKAARIHAYIPAGLGRGAGKPRAGLKLALGQGRDQNMPGRERKMFKREAQIELFRPKGGLRP